MRVPRGKQRSSRLYRRLIASAANYWRFSFVAGHEASTPGDGLINWPLSAAGGCFQVQHTPARTQMRMPSIEVAVGLSGPVSVRPSGTAEFGQTGPPRLGQAGPVEIGPNGPSSPGKKRDHGPGDGILRVTNDQQRKRVTARSLERSPARARLMLPRKSGHPTRSLRLQKKMFRWASRRKHSREFKIEAVKQVVEEGRSVSEGR